MNALDVVMEEEIERRLKSKWEIGAEDDPDGAAAMREASAKVLAENAMAIALGMARKAAGGDVQCAKFLEDRAAEHRKLMEARARKPKRSLATEWGSEPEWTEEDDAAARAEQSKSA